MRFWTTLHEINANDVLHLHRTPTQTIPDMGPQMLLHDSLRHGQSGDPNSLDLLRRLMVIIYMTLDVDTDATDWISPYGIYSPADIFFFIRSHLQEVRSNKTPI